MIEKLRRTCRMTARAIASQLRLCRSTVSGVLARLGLGRLKHLDPPEPVRRYERERPGNLIHLDIKKLGRFRREGLRVTGCRRKNSRGAGWECVHVCIDDHSRMFYVEGLENAKGVTAAGCYRAAGDDRQRFLLPFKRVCGGPHGLAPEAYPHPARHPKDQRQGRAVYPNPAEGVGLCSAL